MKYLVFSVLSILLLVSCAPAEEPAPAAEPEAIPAAAGPPTGTRDNPFMGHGVIQEINDGQLVIEHETIPGFMAAMTMAFPVADEVNVGGLEVGDEIMFDIELLPEGYQVFSVSEVDSEP